MFEHPLLVAGVVSVVALAVGALAVLFSYDEDAKPRRRRPLYMDGWQR